MRDEHPDWSSKQVARAANDEPRRVINYRRGRAIRCRVVVARTGSAAIEEEIDQMIAAGKTHRQVADELKRRYPKQKTPSASGVGYYLAKRGVKSMRAGGGFKIERFDAEIRRLAAEGRSKRKYARALGDASHTGIIQYINRLGLRPFRGIAESASSDPKETPVPQALLAGLVTKVGTTG